MLLIIFEPNSCDFRMNTYNLLETSSHVICLAVIECTGIQTQYTVGNWQEVLVGYEI